jgi:hypothetical protein
MEDDLSQYVTRWDQASSYTGGLKVKTDWGIGFILKETLKSYVVVLKNDEKHVKKIDKRELEEANIDRDIFASRLFFRDRMDLARQMQTHYPKKTLHERKQESDLEESLKDSYHSATYNLFK